MRRPLLLALALLAGSPAGAPAQSELERSGNVQGVWTLPRWTASFAFSHRFEPIQGGDEVINLPTLTLALGLPLGLTAGLDMTTFSEVIPATVTGNETEYWLKRALPLGAGTTVAGLVGYNTAAESIDGAVSARQTLGRVSLFGEVRAFSDLFGLGEAGAAGTVGAALRLTEYLAATGDVGRVLSADSFPTAWSAGVAVAIPGTPHTLSFQATNAGATTLHGASRGKNEDVGPGDVRYGFTFTVPLGSGSRWRRIFRPVSVAPAEAGSPAAVRVDMRQIRFAPGEIRIRAGESVEWTNRDPVEHNVMAADGSWNSGMLREGERHVQRFERPGTYPYLCVPHPGMTGVVIVQ